MSGPRRPGTRQTGRLDRFGPVATRLRAVAGPARTGASALTRRVRRVMREPAALRDAERARLTALARAAVAEAGPGAVGTDMSAALDAAVTAWLADPGPVTGALLSQVQGRHRAAASQPEGAQLDGVPLDGVPLDVQQRLTVLLPAWRSARTGTAA